MPPYTLLVDAYKKIGSRPDSRAASSVLNVPKALASKSSLGLITDVVTATCPAKWTMISASLAASINLVSASHIPDYEPECVVPELILQPVNIARRARARQIVKDSDMFIALKQPVDVVRTDKSRSRQDTLVMIPVCHQGDLSKIDLNLHMNIRTSSACEEERHDQSKHKSTNMRKPGNTAPVDSLKGKPSRIQL